MRIVCRWKYDKKGTLAGLLESLTNSGDIKIIDFENELTEMAELYKVFGIRECCVCVDQVLAKSTLANNQLEYHVVSHVHVLKL